MRQLPAQLIGNDVVAASNHDDQQAAQADELTESQPIILPAAHPTASQTAAITGAAPTADGTIAPSAAPETTVNPAAPAAASPYDVMTARRATVMGGVTPEVRRYIQQQQLGEMSAQRQHITPRSLADEGILQHSPSRSSVGINAGQQQEEGTAVMDGVSVTNGADRNTVTVFSPSPVAEAVAEPVSAAAVQQPAVEVRLPAAAAVESAAEPVRRSTRVRKVKTFYSQLDDVMPMMLSAYKTSVSKAVSDCAYGELSREAIKGEIDNMIESGALLPVLFSDIPAEKRSSILPAHMFIKVKAKADGSFDKVKARLVAGGDKQSSDLYDNTYSPTINPVIIFTILNIIAHADLACMTIDVKMAFLKSPVEPTDPDIYARIGADVMSVWTSYYDDYSAYINNNGSAYFKLGRFLYGLKNAPFKFYMYMNKILQEMGFKQSVSDDCLYTRLTGSYLTIVAVHVDDLLVAAPLDSDLQQFKKELSERFEVSTQEGNNFSYLGLSIERDRRRRLLRVNQRGFLQDILSKYQQVKMRASAVPAADDLTSIHTSDRADKHEYLSVLMSLMYLARFTRPDILFAVTALAPHAEQPSQHQLQQAYKIVSYLKHSPCYSLVFDGRVALHLKVFADASHALHADGKGHTGILVTLGSAPVAVKSGKQKQQGLSSTDAEIIAAAEALTYVLFFRVLLSELGFDLTLPIPVYQDNMSAMALYQGGGTFKRSKHLLVRRGFIRDLIDQHIVQITYLSTHEHPADILTKPVTAALMKQVLAKLRVSSND